MGQLKHTSAQTVFEIGDFTVPLDFETASCYLLLRQTLMAKDSPRRIHISTAKRLVRARFDS